MVDRPFEIAPEDLLALQTGIGNRFLRTITSRKSVLGLVFRSNKTIANRDRNHPHTNDTYGR